ncbi:unnamed protein product, partial [Allacma fusca]
LLICNLVLLFYPMGILANTILPSAAEAAGNVEKVGYNEAGIHQERLARFHKFTKIKIKVS